MVPETRVLHLFYSSERIMVRVMRVPSGLRPQLWLPIRDEFHLSFIREMSSLLRISDGGMVHLTETAIVPPPRENPRKESRGL